MLRLETLPGANFAIVREALSPAECARLRAVAFEGGFAAAPVTTARGPVMRPDIRNNTRFMTDRADLAAELWDKTGPALATWLAGLAVCGFNERLRFYRYVNGQGFAPHLDGHYARPGTEQRSTHTVLFYLSDGYEGGQTVLYRHDVQFRARMGEALVFEHRQLHEGAPVTQGEKVVCRTDLMVDFSRYG